MLTLAFLLVALSFALSARNARRLYGRRRSQLDGADMEDVARLDRAREEILETRLSREIEALELPRAGEE